MKADTKTHVLNALGGRVRKLLVIGSALSLALANTNAAWATIDNTVTATGTSPGGSAGDITATADESVDVQNAGPALVVTKTSSDSNVGAGDTVTYTYTVTNTGNITLNNVSLSDSHDGAGAPVTPVFVSSPLTDNDTSGDSTDAGGDAIWDVLAPLDVVTWEATYDVVQGDINNNGGGDGDIDNTVTASATPAAGTLGGTLTASLGVTLEAQNASLSVSKIAILLNGSPLADPDVANAVVNDVITYEYVVTNNGNLPITDVSLSDDVTSNAGATDPTPTMVASPLTDNDTTGDSTDDSADQVWDVLAPLDSVTYRATYTVTQQDVDNQ